MFDSDKGSTVFEEEAESASSDVEDGEAVEEDDGADGQFGFEEKPVAETLRGYVPWLESTSSEVLV